MTNEIEIDEGQHASFDRWHVKLVEMRGARGQVIYLGRAAADAQAKFLELVKALQRKEAS